MSWLDDGQGAVKPGSSPSEFLIEGKPRPGTPVNARFSTAITKEAAYFEIDALNVNDSCFIGITTESAFKSGYGCKGLLYGRNLADGGALVHQGYGPAVESGCTVGVLTEFVAEGAEHKVAVTFWHNGNCLGPAFLSRMAVPGAPVFPMVQNSKDGSRFAIRFAPAPEMAAAAPADPREGRWTLQRLFVGPELGEFPLQDRLEDESNIVLKVEKGKAPGEFDFRWRVVNNCHTTVISVKDDAVAPFDKLTPSKIAATLMLGPDGMMEIEQKLSEGVEGLAKWILTDGALMLQGPCVEMELLPAGPGDDALAALPATKVVLP